MTTLLLALLLSMSLSVSARETTPVEPAYAADQSQLTAESLNYEIAQFRAISEWNTTLDQLAMMKAEQQEMKIKWERAVALYKTKDIAVETYVLNKFNYESRALEIQRLESNVNRFHAAIVFNKAMVQSLGNPGLDLRAVLLQARGQELTALLASLEFQLKIKEEEHRLLTGRLLNGQTLQKKNALSQAGVDLRASTERVSADQVAALKSQIQVARLALGGAQMAQSRLQQDLLQK